MGSCESVLKKYIDSRGGEEDRDKLRELFKIGSVDQRYELLINVRGGVDGTWTGVYRGACGNDLESIKYMLDHFSANQIYDVVKIQGMAKWTALHTAAINGYTSIINYLLSELSQQQKYDLLKIQSQNGYTALYIAASSKKVEAVKAIISSVSSPLLIQLLNIKDNQGQTVTDIRPELHDELPFLANQSW